MWKMADDDIPLQDKMRQIHEILKETRPSAHHKLETGMSFTP